MYVSVDEARSDFILAAAMAVFGPLLLELLFGVLPMLHQTGPLGNLISAGLGFVITGLVPVLLARYRGLGLAAFGLDGPRRGWAAGLGLAGPVIVVGMLAAWTRGCNALGALLGSFCFFTGGPVSYAVTGLGLTVAFLGSLLLYTFLTVMAANGFSGRQVNQHELLRTFGLGAAAVSLILGLVMGAFGRAGLARVSLEAATLVVVLVLADQLVTAGARTSRITALGPAVVALLLNVRLFAPSLLVQLRGGLLAAGIVLVGAVLLETRRYAWAVVPLLAALVVYPSALSPTPYT